MVQQASSPVLWDSTHVLDVKCILLSEGHLSFILLGYILVETKSKNFSEFADRKCCQGSLCFPSFILPLFIFLSFVMVVAFQCVDSSISFHSLPGFLLPVRW
jgi:hypothetical protein